MGTKKSSSALIVDAKNNLLVVRRSGTHPWAPYEPDLPGGFIEKNESHRRGLAREIKEETGIDIAPDDLKEAGVIKHFDFKHVNKIEHSLYAYRVKKQPQVTLSWEHDQFSWIPLEEVTGLEKPMQFQLKELISKGYFDTL